MTAHGIVADVLLGLAAVVVLASSAGILVMRDAYQKLHYVAPVVVMGWFLVTHAQTSPSGGFQGGVVLATAFILIYLSGEFLLFRRISPADVTDAVEAVGAGGFAAIGISALAMGLPYLKNFLPRGTVPGAVSFFVGLEVAAAFVLIVGELIEQTLLVRQGER